MKQFYLFLLFLSPVMAYSQVNLTQGLKAYYSFSGNANDVSGNNNNPVFNNATLTTDRSGNPNSAYHFNGTDNYMQIPNNSTINSGNTLSLCVWVRPMGYYAGTCHGNSIMMKGDADYLTGNYFLRFDDGFYSNYTNCSSSLDIAHQNFYGPSAAVPAPGYTPYIQTNQWYSVIVTLDGSTAKLYINCDLKYSGPQGNITFTNAYDLFLGKLNSGAFPYWLNGDLDEVRIYDRAINQDEVNVLADCNVVTPCNNWLNTIASNAYAGIGDLDIAGNQVTVEALINRTQPYLPGGGNDTEGDIVSKHTDFNDINYLLRPNHAYITTTNGFFGTPDVCDLQLNKTYHVAMVYNGSTLKFFRNGFLMSQINATGNLFQNNLNTQIGHYAATFWNTQFLGFINEVRIWNIARTQAQIQTYMNGSLPSPATQTGLQAYYTFDNLLNKQGNAAWNGTLNGAASINNTNTSCNFIADSCATVIAPAGISGIINAYTPVLALNPCDNKITVEDATAYNTGDTVMMIQMKGAVVDSTNTVSFGTITDYKNAGNYEFNYVKSKSGNIIELKNKLTRQYDIPTGKVQLVRVPYYNSVTISDTLTCLPWDGRKGGIVVLNVKDTATLNNDINVNGKGFKGGAGYNANTGTLGCFNNGYTYPISFQLSGNKGESITTISDNLIRGKGKLAAAGGAGLGHNSGGGGGANGGVGGTGGYQLDNCGSAPFNNRGIGGDLLQYSTAINKVFLGSGGGGGQADNIGYTASDGGNGGGMVIIIANYLQSNAHKIVANGSNGSACVQSDCHDAMGGGGGGGTVLMAVNNYIDNSIVTKNGGNGGSVLGNIIAGGKIGPGGGGGGGTLLINKPGLPASLSSNNIGGANGVLVNAGNDPWGASAGSNGVNIFNLVIPVDTVLFKPNIDSVRIKDSSTTCLAFDFNGFGYTNTNPITTWNWYFGDGGTANTQNTAHSYATAGTYLVKLVVTDINGCKDSVTRNVISNTLSVNAGTDSSFCGGPVSVQLNGTVSGTGNYSWTPAVYLNNSTVTNPVATVNTTTTFYFSVSNASGCSGQDSVTIHVDATPVVKTIGDTAVCKGSLLMLSTTPGLGSYHWSPGIYVSDSTIANPLFIDTVPRTLIVTGSNGACFASDTINVNIKSLPVVYAGADTIICSAQLVSLSASGALSYSWSPALFLSNPNIANPVFSGNASTTYFLTGTGANGCQGKDTVSVNVSNSASLVKPPNKSFCSKESVQLDGNNGNAVQYLWAPTTYLNNPAIINPVANPPATTTYTVKVTDTTCNFDSSFAVIVTVNSLPSVNASRSNDIDCALKNARLSATGATQYTWQPPGTLSSSSIANPVATPVSNTLYVVTGTDNNGCKNNDSVTVLVKGGINGYDIPNSFTPNGDSNNECFGIKHWGDAQNVIFIIFNRWGEKVFETNNVNICWDGSFRGQAAEVGNYVYYASARTACGDLVRKGNVLLIR